MLSKDKFLAQHWPEEAVHPTLLALWHDAQGQWDLAHQYAQSKEGDPIYDRIHAYLHRKEGDTFNAKWWYKTIGVAYPSKSLEQEWQELFEEYATLFKLNFNLEKS
jgi:hypothetical protein